MEIKNSKRFAGNLRASDIPATLADASASLGNIGGLFRTIDETLSLAVARALIDATQPEADRDAIFGSIGLALQESGLASGPARAATRCLAEAERFASKADKPLKPGQALREAQEITAAMLGHETARRKAKAEERKAKAEERKAKADAALESAQKRADKAEAEAAEAREGYTDLPEFVLLGEDGHVTPLTPDEYTALALTLQQMREERKAGAAASRKATRDHAKKQREGGLAAIA